MTEIERLRAELAAAHDKYQRDVFGLNNEGDPIGGDPPSGLKRRAEKAEAELAAANAREAGLRDLNERLVASLAAAVEGPWDHAKDMPLALTAIADSAAVAQPSTGDGE